MPFTVAFHPPAAATARPAAPLREPNGDDGELVPAACTALAEAGGGRFHLGGFGDDEWPLDVAYDLSVFMEQLPPLLAGLRAGGEADVDMYSQGIERTLTFRVVGDRVDIFCASGTDWTPQPRCESMPRSELTAMLTRLAADVARGLRAIGSDLARVEPFADWARWGGASPGRGGPTPVVRAFAAFKALAYPDAVHIAGFGDWAFRLVTLDAHIAGYASRVADGSMAASDVPDLAGLVGDTDDLGRELDGLAEHVPTDAWAQHRAYFGALRDLLLVLVAQADRDRA